MFPAFPRLCNPDGEANVFQENIEAFLALAEELNLKDLTGNKSSNTEEEVDVKPHERKRKTKLNVCKNEEITFNPNKLVSERKSFEEPSEVTERAVVVANSSRMKVSITDVQELDEQVKSMITKSLNRTADGKQAAHACTVCGKEGYSNGIKDHIEANHLEGVSIPCNSCEKRFRSRSALKQHCFRNHK